MSRKISPKKNGIKKLEYLNNNQTLKATCVSPKSAKKYTCEVTFTGAKISDHKCTCLPLPQGKGLPCHHIGALLLACKWEQERKKTNTAKGMRMYITPSMVLSPEDKQREDAVRQKILQYSNHLLVNELSINGQSSRGKKDVLTERCVWGALHGALPKCPRCKVGHLKYFSGTYYCTATSTNSNGEPRCPPIGVDSIKRTPWHHVE